MKHALIKFIASALLLFSGYTYAYPTQPIKIIVAAGVGETCDIFSRMVATKLAENLKRSEEHTSELQSH